MIVEIYSKDNCGYCTSAINLLRSKNIKFTEEKLGVHFTTEMISEKFPTAKTFPIIVVDGMYIGGYSALTEEIKKTSSNQLFLAG